MEIDCNWVFKETLGQGSFGIVELWKNTCNNEEIAIKKCKSSASLLTAKQKERWIQEIYIMNRLNHPNIIATKPVPNEVKRMEKSLPVLCMEYCRKQDLRKVLNKTENWCGFNEPVAVQIMKDISSAVEYLHAQKITHRDLKPENIVLQQINDKVIYKLIDLGYAKELGQDSIYASVVGTMNYIAPELLWNDKYTCTSDYWSLGILFYEVITGCRPFLPDETNPINWKKHIEKKSDQDICVRRINGNVIYLQDIQYPMDISQCSRVELVDWFRIVLQWDPKRRGKQRRDNRTDEIVVFKMLKRILSKRIVRIFSVSQYQIYSYAIDCVISIRVIKSLVEKDSGIPVSSQELIDSLGNVLSDGDVLKDTLLTLFRNDSTQLVDLPAPNFPTIVGELFELSKTELCRYDLKCCYASAMFFLKKEQELFGFYILALSMKIDLIASKLDTLLLKKSEMISRIDSLRTDFDSTKELLQQNGVTTSDYWQREIKIAMDKLEHLATVANDLKIKCDKFLRISESLKGFGGIDWMIEYEEFLTKAQDMMDSLRSRPAEYKQKPILMAKLIGNFVNFRQTRIENPELHKIRSQIQLMATPQATEDLSKLEKFIESAVALTDVYRGEICNLRKKWQNQRRVASSDSQNEENMEIESIGDGFHSSANSSRSINETICGNSDSVIIDNLVIRYMMHDVITDTYEKFLQIVNLDP